jgi:methylphosphotriester-DNA--protein-cysteine methyltransferase
MLSPDADVAGLIKRLLVVILIRQALGSLDRARDDLAQANGSVTDIAYHWGFTNPGRFAHAYRNRFGEFPAATLDEGRTRAITP